MTNHKKSMGEGEIISEMTPPNKWKYPKSNSSSEGMYNKICEEHQ